MDKNTYRKSVKRQTLEGKTALMCFKCATDISDMKEDHHVYGRNNSDETIPLCKNCHSPITIQQNKLPREVRSSNASREEKIRFILVSVGTLLEGIGEQLRLIGLEADSL